MNDGASTSSEFPLVGRTLVLDGTPDVLRMSVMRGVGQGRVACDVVARTYEGLRDTGAKNVTVPVVTTAGRE